MSNPYNSATERASVLGPTLYFKGDLSAEEDLLIQGRVEGSITHTQRLTVGAQGTVKANIRAQLIIVEGTVDGDLQAEKSVFVKETAKVSGNIYAPDRQHPRGRQFQRQHRYGRQEVRSDRPASMRAHPRAWSEHPAARRNDGLVQEIRRWR